MSGDETFVAGDNLYLIPPNSNPRMEALFAILSSDEKGEGICASMMPNGTWMTMVTSEQRLVPTLIKAAETMAKDTKMRLKLVKFTKREEIQNIGSWQ